MAKYASIDIGTNTLRLLIAGVEPSGRLVPLVYERAITRLGGGYTPETGIDEGSAERTIWALEGFSEKIKKAGVDDVRAVATSVVRRAANSARFLESVKKRTGLDVKVIHGDEEARLSLLGVRSVLDEPPDRRLLVFDIGGGSTEFVAAADGSGGTGGRGELITPVSGSDGQVGRGGRAEGLWSMEMGVVHLTEKHLISDPPRKAELEGLKKEVDGVIGELKGLMAGSGVDLLEYSAGKGALLVGTAGTITTLAAIDLDLAVYDRERINNHTLTVARVSDIFQYLVGLTLKDREKLLSLEKGREDLIIAGTIITLAVMKAFGFKELKVSDAGLLEGVILAAHASP